MYNNDLTHMKRDGMKINPMVKIGEKMKYNTNRIPCYHDMQSQLQFMRKFICVFLKINTLEMIELIIYLIAFRLYEKSKIPHELI